MLDSSVCGSGATGSSATTALLTALWSWTSCHSLEFVFWKHCIDSTSAGFYPCIMGLIQSIAASLKGYCFAWATILWGSAVFVPLMLLLTYIWLMFSMLSTPPLLHWLTYIVILSIVPLLHWPFLHLLHLQNLTLSSCMYHPRENSKALGVKWKFLSE